MLHQLTIVAVAASGLLASVTTTSAETTTVCASGCDYTSINAMISVASDGDVIQLAAETYFEGEQIDTPGAAFCVAAVCVSPKNPMAFRIHLGGRREGVSEASSEPGGSLQSDPDRRQA